LEVEREGVKVRDYVHRSYAEFYEFASKIEYKFNNHCVRALPSGFNLLGRTNIREVAERRKHDISDFLRTLFISAEVAKCDLVYLFFHPLYRDQQIREMNQPLEGNIIPQPGRREFTGDIQLKIQRKRQTLEILVKHARNLCNVGHNQPPNPYVKCYIRHVQCLPGTNTSIRRYNKRKTRVIPGTTNPTYNEILQYTAMPDDLCSYQLEVTVWHCEPLNQNSFIGGTLISLQELLAHDVIEDWFKLVDIWKL